MPPLSNKQAPSFQALGLPVLIGSVPMHDHSEALELIMDHTPHIPLWPQLPSRPEEGMLVQFIEGFPGITHTAEKTYFDITVDSFDENLLAFFEEYLAVNEDQELLADSRFQVSQECAPGIFTLVEKLRGQTTSIAVKGQVTGPFTMLTGLHDQNKRLGYYDPTIRELITKGIAMKAAWQVKTLARTELPVILFIDEPALAGLGSSAFISISLEDIKSDLSETVNAIHQAGGLAGVHVCANTEWPLLLEMDLDVISFDAHGFFDRFITCRGQIHAYLDRGGIIAWGGVPTGSHELIAQESSESLAALWETQMDQLINERYDKAALLRQTFITPSCGTGSLSLDDARKVLAMSSEVSAILRQKYLMAD